MGMSAWRRVANECTPWAAKIAEEAPSPMALWIELLLIFERAFDSGEASRVENIMRYARWCWDSPSSDTVTAVACAFFEHLPEHPGIRKAIPSLFSRAEFERLRDVFRYHAGDAVVGELALECRSSPKGAHARG
jgi:hypothetical protein